MKAIKRYIKNSIFVYPRCCNYKSTNVRCNEDAILYRRINRFYVSWNL